MDTSEASFYTSFTENCVFPLHSLLRSNLKLVLLLQSINSSDSPNMHGSPNSSETLPSSQPSGGTQNCLLLCLACWNSSGSHPGDSADPFSRAADGSAETADCRVSNLLGMLQTHCLLIVQIPYNLLDGLRDRGPSRNPERILAESREMPSPLTFSVSQIQQVWMEYNFFSD